MQNAKQIAVIVACLGAAWMLLRQRTAQAAQPQEIATQGPSNGWRYFTDGTSIDPAGNYYKGGKLVYTAGLPVDASGNMQFDP